MRGVNIGALTPSSDILNIEHRSISWKLHSNTLNTASIPVPIYNNMQPSQYTSAPGPQQSYRSQYTTVASGPQFTPLAPGPQQGYGQSTGTFLGHGRHSDISCAPPTCPNHHYGYHNGDIQSCLSHTQSHPHLTGTSDQHQQAPLLSYINTRTNKSPHSLPPNISSSIAGSHDMGTATSRVPLTQSNAPAARDHDRRPGNLDPALNDLAPLSVILPRFLVIVFQVLLQILLATRNNHQR
ncbi:hypothetical protein H4Q26_010244 [Puccinia striiformis f. sp. tritici PST-130]|nr:hypothetical protein H4Q26_010244 [Puccinia striiformis f. sp. tritici PST-130]